MRVAHVPAVVAVVLCAAAAAAAAPDGAAAGTGREGPGPPTAREAWAGRLLAPVYARAAPRLSARPRRLLQPIAPLSQGPTILLVTRSLRVDGRLWLEVLLPVRPNGTRGWVPADVMRLRRVATRIEIDLGDRRLSLYRAGRRVMRVPVAVGKPGTPTPTGRHFAIAEVIRTRTPGAFLGPVVFPLTGYSERLNEFAGGDGRVAIHGTSLPSLIGTRASNGCIRMRNGDVLRMSRLVRPGTPVAIRP